MELGNWRDCPSLCGSARLRNTHTTQSRAGCTGASSDNSQVVPRHGQWPCPTHLSLATVTAPCLVLPKPDGQHGGGRAVAREDIGSPPAAHIHYSVLSVCLSDFFTFARAFWAWISRHAFVLPAKLDSRPKSVHSDTCQSSQAEGNKGPVDMTEP